ncbi:hypothetical protein K435DRAFT_878058 [Dendrothele bispora CBS 962.96]|uniref:Uncharacterized protein n=1 Tax=Dendrothele bispora (strain CBS 962.96) TaxID=1314807 RepID=A0A4S8KPQ2_DENBC|nr:hypothetical protein K435DRAFT_878058 [Dendrothele bispora CBS 962.96]
MVAKQSSRSIALPVVPPSSYSDDLFISPATDTSGSLTNFNDKYDEPIDPTQKRHPSATESDENWDIGSDLVQCR